MIRFNDNAHVQQTIRCKISDAQIRKYARDPRVKQLKDERYSLYFCYRKDRSKGSWRFFSYQGGKQSSLVFAHYPKTNAAQAIKLLKENDEQDTSLVRHDFLWLVNDVLDWHISRQEKLSKLAKNRLITMRSMFNAHLYAIFDGVEAAELTYSIIDDYLVVPLLSKGYSLSYVRSMFQLIKVAFGTAHSMKKLSSDPVTGMKWTHFVKQPIRPKPPKLMPINILSTLQSIGDAEPIPQALSMMMLCHGTRIGETRLAKWCHINFHTKQWVVPAGNTKSKKGVVYPLTDEMVEFLQSYKRWQLAHYYKGNHVFPLTRRDKAPIHRAGAGELIKQVSKGLWTAHDLRKLARTVWADLGVDYLVAESLLNHAKDKLDVIYVHSEVELQKRKALKKYHHWLKNCWRTCALSTNVQPIFS